MRYITCMPSVVYKINDETFSDAVKTSQSIRDALLKCGLNGTGGAYRVFKKRVKQLGLDTSHFMGQGFLKGKTHNWNTKIPLENILIKNSSYTNMGSLKKRLINQNLLKNECYECGLKDVWNNKPIVLQIDHINGHHLDHRISNLRLLCPNCHSQTETFAGKNQLVG